MELSVKEGEKGYETEGKGSNGATKSTIVDDEQSGGGAEPQDTRVPKLLRSRFLC